MFETGLPSNAKVAPVIAVAQSNALAPQSIAVVSLRYILKLGVPNIAAAVALWNHIDVRGLSIMSLKVALERIKACLLDAFAVAIEFIGP